MKYYRSDLGTVTDGHARPAYAHLTVNFQPDSASFFLSNDAAVVCLCNKGDLQMLNEDDVARHQLSLQSCRARQDDQQCSACQNP